MLRLHLGHGQRPRRSADISRVGLLGGLTQSLRSGSPNPQWKRKKEDHFCVLFVKASGCFLTPSSFVPERELTSPHGFQQVKEGRVRGAHSPAARPPRRRPAPRPSRPPGLAPWLLLPAAGFLRRKGKKSQTTTKEERKKKATSEHAPSQQDWDSLPPPPKELHRNTSGNTLV